MTVALADLALDNTPIVTLAGYSVDLMYQLPGDRAWREDPLVQVKLDAIKVCEILSVYERSTDSRTCFAEYQGEHGHHS